MKKVYKVWVRICVEEYDPVADEHRNVIDWEEGLAEDKDPEEYASLEFNNYKEARNLADNISSSLPGLFGGKLNE